MLKVTALPELPLQPEDTAESTEWPVSVLVIFSTSDLKGPWQGGGGTNWFGLRVTVQFKTTARIIPLVFAEDSAERLNTEARKESLSLGNKACWEGTGKLVSPETLIICQSDTQEDLEMMLGGEIARNACLEKYD
ncbi:hypothetical protein Baya_13246 [Bagarius yarrelli]|uniref:Uncharacterized protein n=1 Tax=Bagarius yarrelli TaxID=175774 RepID=A0A556V564_BAGYA|nr:hypothetical protein Baya_13246 [Bagarius yarrelli]